MANQTRPRGIFSVFREINNNNQDNLLDESFGSSLPDISQDSEHEMQFELELESSNGQEEASRQIKNQVENKMQELDKSTTNEKENIPPGSSPSVYIRYCETSLYCLL